MPKTMRASAATVLTAVLLAPASMCVAQDNLDARMDALLQDIKRAIDTAIVDEERARIAANRQSSPPASSSSPGAKPEPAGTDRMEEIRDQVADRIRDAYSEIEKNRDGNNGSYREAVKKIFKNRTKDLKDIWDD